MRRVPLCAYAFPVLAGVLFLFNSCSKKKDQESLVITPTTNPIQYSVLVYLMTPNDQTFNPDYYRAVKSTILNIQDWYKTQMGGKTFLMNPVVVDTLTGFHPTAWYRTDNGPGISGNSVQAYHNVVYELKQLLGARYDTVHYDYMVWVPSDFPDETIPRGVGVEGLDNLNHLTQEYHDAWIGAAGHALGHSFGLPEVAVPNADGIMSEGYPHYPNCVLQSFEKDSLNRSPFFQQVAQAP